MFIATSRQAEAQSNLGIIAKLQQTYQLKYIGKYYANSNFQMGQGSSGGTCGNDENSQQNELGFRVSQCSRLRYTYSTPNGPNPGINQTIGEAKNYGHATRYIYPKCGSADEWTISRNRNLNNSDKVMVNCNQ